MSKVNIFLNYLTIVFLIVHSGMFQVLFVYLILNTDVYTIEIYTNFYGSVIIGSKTEIFDGESRVLVQHAVNMSISQNRACTTGING